MLVLFAAGSVQETFSLAVEPGRVYTIIGSTGDTGASMSVTNTPNGGVAQALATIQDTAAVVYSVGITDPGVLGITFDYPAPAADTYVHLAIAKEITV